MAASRKMFLSLLALSGALGHLGRSASCDRVCAWLRPRSSLIRGLFRRPGPAAAQLRGGRPARSVGITCRRVIAWSLCCAVLCFACALALVYHSRVYPNLTSCHGWLVQLSARPWLQVR